MPQRHVPSARTAETEARWLATLTEVRRQAARVAEAAGVQARRALTTHSAPGWPLSHAKAYVCAVPGAAAGPLPRDSHTGVQAPDTDGVWFDVREGRNVAPAEDCVEASGAWHAQQWLNAFCVLVRELGARGRPAASSMHDSLEACASESCAGTPSIC